MNNFNIDAFNALGANPGGTLELFKDYTEQLELLFQLVFRKADGTPYDPSDKEKKAMLLFKGGKDMKNLFQHVGKVLDTDTYNEAVKKITDDLSDRTNKIVQRNMLLSSYPQGSKSFEKWSQEISNVAKLISYDNYDWKQAAVDAIILQTSNSKLRERALQENVTYDELLKMGIVKEQSAKGAALLENASNQTNSSTSRMEEEVRRLQSKNKQLKSRLSRRPCSRCGHKTCPQGSKCAANGQKCSKCKKMNHFAKVCRSNEKKRSPFGRLSSAENSETDEECGRVVVGKLDSCIGAKVRVRGPSCDESEAETIVLATDTGISKTLLNSTDWRKIKKNCTFVKTSKQFRPYGTSYHLPIKGKAKVTLTAERGASIETWVYVVDDKREESLLGENDAVRLGIVKLDLKGSTEEVVSRITYAQKAPNLSKETVSDGQTQGDIDASMQNIINNFPNVFTNRTGKFKGEPIQIQCKPDYTPVIQPSRRIPLHYVSKLKTEIETMVKEDIIEGPITMEEPGTFLSNLVITDKDTDRIRVTLDCQAVNKVIYTTHEPIPTSDELRHQLQGSNCFSTLDMTNCYYQFEIEEKARKLYAFRTPWGIYEYKRMVMGTSPASSEIQKKIREIICRCPNAIHIKDDILVHGVGQNHDHHLREVLKMLQDKGITLRPEKCHLGQPQVKWFGNIYSKDGVSPDPDKCSIIKNWPAPTSNAAVKSFLQTVQFNAKFLGGTPSYPELTAPLRELTKKNSHFTWGPQQQSAFEEIKKRLCSDRVLVPYDTKLKTRLYVDSSYIGTQATVAQSHCVNGEETWRPVHHTSRAWTKAEAGYSQIERESNGILTGAYMNRMYTLGTHIEVVTDHQPLIPIYNSTSKPKQLRIDRHRTKLLPFQYTVVYEPGSQTPCNYGSCHPPQHMDFTETEISEWCIEQGTDIFVNRVIEDNLPKALSIEMLQHHTKKDTKLSLLSRYVQTHKEKHCQKDLPAYSGIFNELTLFNGMILRGEQVIIPPSLYSEVTSLAHEGHQGADKTLKLLRETCWFPGMRNHVIQYVKSCIACNAATSHENPVPLEPNLLPQRPWQKLHADFKGPIGGQYYLHIVVDQYSKYPEVDVVSSTSFTKLKPVLDRIFATHGYPETMTADNGPPYPSSEMKQYAKEKGFRLTPVSPKDPRGNGFVENFVKNMCKLIHTSMVEK